MRGVAIAYVVCILIYSVLIFNLLLIKEKISGRLPTEDEVKGKKAFDFNTFNMVLASFIIVLIGHICMLVFFNKTDVNCLFNQIMARFYIVAYYIFILFFTVYNCRVAFGWDIDLHLKSVGFASFLGWAANIIVVLLCFLPLNIGYDGNFFVLSGPAFIFMFVANTITYSLCFYAFMVNRKNVDLFKAWGPLLFPVLFSISIYFYANYGFNSFEIIIAYTLIIVYYALEKREEKLQNEIVAITLNLEKANRFKSDFLSSMSHEIKTPLNSILATSRMLIEKEDVNYSTKKQINDIVYSSDLLRETIMNILTISKVEIDKLTVSNVTFDLNNELKTLPFIEKIRIDSLGANFMIDSDESLPKLLNGPKELIRSIIDNALTYTIESIKGGIITLKLSYKDENLIISIQSLSNVRKNIYENVENLDVDIYSTFENKDFGLGIASILTKKLNGKIKSNYENNKNVLTFIIPCKENTSSIDFDSLRFDGKKALVVDDVDINLKVANRVLTNLGFECKFDHSGYEAIEDVKHQDFDIIFLDIMMPNMGGEDTLKQFKNISTFKTPVIALTADEIADARQKYISEGFEGYIIKPFTKEDVINEIYDMFGGENK